MRLNSAKRVSVAASPKLYRMCWVPMWQPMSGTAIGWKKICCMRLTIRANKKGKRKDWSAPGLGMRIAVSTSRVLASLVDCMSVFTMKISQRPDLVWTYIGMSWEQPPRPPLKIVVGVPKVIATAKQRPVGDILTGWKRQTTTAPAMPWAVTPFGKKPPPTTSISCPFLRMPPDFST